jgi:hypothetical protein
MNAAVTVPANVAESLTRLEVRPLFTLRLDVGIVQKIGGQPVSQVGVITGGSFEGDRLSGKVLDGGSDWQTIRADGSILLDCRLVLETAGGARIAMTYAGIRAGPPGVQARLAKGAPVDPAEYYLRVSPLFCTAAPKYEWLNRVLAIGTGHRLPEGPVYSIFEVL